MASLARTVARTGRVPVAWASLAPDDSRVNLGDALSPVMVALLGGRPIVREPMKGRGLRLGAVGTVGHAFVGGDVTFWGTGSSYYSNPSAPKGVERRLYRRPFWTRVDVRSTRGPISRQILGDGGRSPVYGDPVWLLERFYRPKIEKRWDLGVIIHLSDLGDRDFEPHPKPVLRRYEVAAADAAGVRLINTITPPTAAAMRERIDEILACRRIVSNSLHGLVIPEAYGIPCLYFAHAGPREGLCALDLEDADVTLDMRIVDLYRGFGRRFLPVLVQPRRKVSDWGAILRMIDEAWEPLAFDPEPMVERFPLDPAPIEAPAGSSVFEHPLVAGIGLQA